MFLSSHIGLLPIFLINGDILYTGNNGYKLYNFTTVLNNVSGEKCKHDRKCKLQKVRMFKGNKYDSVHKDKNISF